MSKHRKASKDRHTTWATALELTTLSAVRVALQERFPPPENLPPTIAALVAQIDEGPDSRSGIAPAETGE
jgi:hypothetical protein